MPENNDTDTTPVGSTDPSPNNEPPPQVSPVEQPSPDEAGVEDGYDSETIIGRMEDMCVMPGGRVAVADHANGLVVFSVTGEIEAYMHGDQDTLCFSCRFDPKSGCLVTLVLDTPGWRLNFYDTSNYTIKKMVALPEQEEVPRLKLRWLSISHEGDIYLIVQSYIWHFNQESDSWTMCHRDTRDKAWYSHLTKLPSKNKDEQKFLICFQGDNIQEMKFGKNKMLITKKNILPDDTVAELGAYGVDEKGHVLLSDWSNGNILLLDSEYKVIRQIANVGAGEAYLIAATEGKVFIGCKSSLLVKGFEY